MNYTFSRYVYFVQHDNDTLLYSLASGDLLWLNQQEYSAVCDHTKSSSIGAYGEIINYLKNHGILVPQGKDEVAAVLERHSNAIENAKTLHLTLYVTEECNFCCEYCFVRKHGRVMSDESFEKLFRLVENHIGKYDGLDISWFGGEPLMQFDKLLNYDGRLRKYCKMHGRRYESFLITNGYYLTPENFIRLHENGIRSLQVTFDGTKENHDRYRFDQSGKSFDLIFTNLRKIQKMAYDGFGIKVRCNYIPGSDMKQIGEFIEKYDRYFLKDPRFRLILKPIVNYDEPDPVKLSAIYCNNASSLCKMLEYIPEHADLLIDLISPRNYWCDVCCKNSFVSDTSGNIYMCDSTIGRPEFRMGSVDRSGEIDRVGNAPLINADLWDSCQKCRRLPICYGSCQRVRMTAGRSACSVMDADIIKLLTLYAKLKAEVLSDEENN